jgi:hypothetical protein
MTSNIAYFLKLPLFKLVFPAINPKFAGAFSLSTSPG